MKTAYAISLYILLWIFFSSGKAMSMDQPKLKSNPSRVDLSELPALQGQDQKLIELPAPGIPDYRPRILRDVKLDLGRRLGIDISEIVVESMASKDWPDSGLGCPQYGREYVQRLTPGFVITLNVQGKLYLYHTDAFSKFVLCEKR